MSFPKHTLTQTAPGTPFFTPAQQPPAGTPLSSPTSSTAPTLFTPLTLRSLTLQNRFAVSPMCTYSADGAGRLTPWHVVHLGAFALRGVPLTIVEATAVLPNGRISPEDSGLWEDSQIEPLKRVVEFVHSQGQKVGVQLAHAGRKGSTLAPWHVQAGKGEVAGKEVGGWPEDLWAPSALKWDEGFPVPKEMDKEEIGKLVEAFKEAAKRAVKAGVDVIEIHSAHGYLLSEFLSPITNQRTDEYGGPKFENRVRTLLEVVRAVRGVIPEGMPLFVRISATEWMEWTGQPSWDLEQSKKLALLLADEGVDLLDVSSGGNNPKQQITFHPYYQADLAAAIKQELIKHGKADKMKIGAVGGVTTAELAKEFVQEGGRVGADLVLVARQFLREPEFVLKTAADLGVKVQGPIQYHRAPIVKTEKL
ncbi:uncharacterized protein CTHT_0052870 [Thermochaetoides thermophila DSM 1495]|uniref:NADH:flavin oxidoreductase/NADH oxidase N-terminal domain-containing protein n=1 Tax=Chaetomium thermophilum (strain DSM 1495 / CBS 144.50 / IMI 039719) TaxID=759272 RepID=G0SDS9_CHATD|nr:hypothetical protein CTHT_0052870 [Thermochaetoides thermophila DSM 1495]EGS18680.1 hypothetical protein CTHT_0052870 [Thermochaetoides thermophila DSM 1495]